MHWKQIYIIKIFNTLLKGKTIYEHFDDVQNKWLTDTKDLLFKSNTSIVLWLQGFANTRVTALVLHNIKCLNDG